MSDALTPEPAMLENRTFEELAIGDSASQVRTLEQADIELFAAVSGDVNPAHLDRDFAEKSLFHEVIAHGMWGGALISAVLGTELPGPGTIYLSQNLAFKRPVRVGDTITTTVTVQDKAEAQQRVTLDCLCVNQDGEEVITGEAEVFAPSDKIRRPRAALPEVFLHERAPRLQTLVERAKACGDPTRVAVVHPTTAIACEGALTAAAEGLIHPILIGPEETLRAAVTDAGFTPDDYDFHDAADAHAAAVASVALVREGRAEALMKGALHTDELMHEVIDKTHGLRTERRLSHVYVIDVPAYRKLIYISDAAINIEPDLAAKADIIQNAIEVARALDVATPKVAILAAVESVNPRMRSTIEAAALCKMADRGQITGGQLDGPLAFDNAVSREAARAKGIVSEVAGDADILIAPDLEAGNMIAKQLDYLAGAVAAGLVVGARAPVILTSRAEGAVSRLASCALARLYANRAIG